MFWPLLCHLKAIWENRSRTYLYFSALWDPNCLHVIWQYCKMHIFVYIWGRRVMGGSSRTQNVFPFSLQYMPVTFLILRRIQRHQITNVYRFLCKTSIIIKTSNVWAFFQMKPARCTLILSIFISTSVHVSCNYVPIIRRNYCIYATLIFFIPCGWPSGMQIRQLPIQSKNTSTYCWWWAHSCPKHVEVLK